ncbi:hypothetical protein Micbo1qcDRAFT_223092 [Microdochium bolleyi]|uniref:Rhodopsin domain-containing protein n=1 Tax=Microdochium bolleyi TaxID=196109 RepID=A0A136J8F9_9PEZI|nr:hypothetical protein Micbo1qcDRAFT_223092 [Microdochium bolleyi]
MDSLGDAFLHESRSTEVIAVAWVFTGLAIITVLLKVFTTTRIIRDTGWDDFLIYLSLILSILASFFVHYAAVLGLGRHTAAVLADHGPERLSLTAKMQILGYPFNIAAFSLPNISIAILVNKLLDPNPWRKHSLIGMTVLQVFLAAVMATMAFVQCSPVEKLWNRTMAEGSCWHPSVLNNYSYFVSAYTTLTDLVLAIVPISAFWKLQMNRSTKVGVSVLMGLTFLSAIVTLVKATYLHLFTDTVDPLYNVVTLVYWGFRIEQNIVIFAACAPTLRPLFTRVLFRRKGGSGDRSGSDNNEDTHGSQTYGLKSLSSSSTTRRINQKSGSSGGARETATSKNMTTTALGPADESGSSSEVALSRNERRGARISSTVDSRHVEGRRAAERNNSNNTDDDDSLGDDDVYDNASLSSRRGIWKTVDVSVYWHEESKASPISEGKGRGGEEGPRQKTRREIVVPESLMSEPRER